MANDVSLIASHLTASILDASLSMIGKETENLLRCIGEISADSSVFKKILTERYVLEKIFSLMEYTDKESLDTLCISIWAVKNIVRDNDGLKFSQVEKTIQVMSAMICLMDNRITRYSLKVLKELASTENPAIHNLLTSSGMLSNYTVLHLPF